MKNLIVIFVGCTFLLLLMASPASAQPAAKALVETECSKCHSLSRVNKAVKDGAAWKKTVDRMIKKGANIKPEETDAVIQYLNTLNK
jgi:hypothetical protein